MAEDSDLERTEAATDKRLSQAREKGDIPRSREMATCVLLLAGGAAMWLFGGDLAQKLSNLMLAVFSFKREQALDPHVMLQELITPSIELVITLLPILGMMLFASLFSPILLGGWLFATESLTPNFSRMNPLSGIKRMFSINALVEMLKAVVKTILVGTVAWFVVIGQLDEVLGLSREALKSGMQHMTLLVWISFISIVSALVLIAVMDVPYQLWSYAKKMRMTKEQVKQEHKESDGDPHIKAKIRSIQREMARRRMMAEVPTADVVVTNPTHYAVALKYAEGAMSAPKVIAKGTDGVAQKIREIAEEHKITIMEAPPLARALHHHTEIGDEIPEALYTAVAEVLAYVFQLRMYNTGEGRLPDVPEELNVPKELDPLNFAAGNTAAAASRRVSQ
jgi:flagellar biosynthetic protein FlhB